MVTQSLFFGELELEINTPRAVDWKDCEREFFRPARPCTQKAVVDVEFSDALPKPDAPCVSSSNSYRVFSGLREERLYYPSYLTDQHPSTYSLRDDHRIRVVHVDDRKIWTNPNFHLLTMIHLEQLLLDANALILHSCYTQYQGKAILFTAPSGTGKTTQAQLWKNCFGSTIINGDKCLLQLTADAPLACGFFLHGSAPECENRTMPIEAIVILRRSSRDFVQELSPAQKVGLLYSEVTVNSWDQNAVSRSLELLEKIITKTKVLMLHCTMDDRAAHTLHRYLFGGEYGTV